MATEQKIESSVKELRELKAALDEHAIVAITDGQGKITYVNDKFCSISKFERDELLGQDHRIINSGHHSREFIRDLWMTIAGGKVWHGEIKNRAKDGSFYWVHTTIVPLLDEDGKPHQYVAIRADITERKKAEAEILRLNAELEEANKELEAFTYSISHDLRAPLRAVNGYANIIFEDYGPSLPEEGLNYLQRLRNGGRRMAEMVDGLQRFSQLKRHMLQHDQIDMAQMVREIVRETRLPSGRQIDMQVGDLPIARGDLSLVRQVWVNLLSNAVKYTHGRAPAVIEIGCETGGKALIYFVRDNGVGFDMKYAGKLFGVFQRLHREEEFEGTGIGLAAIQRIVRRHGGRVWAQAEPERGATFYFTLEGDKP